MGEAEVTDKYTPKKTIWVNMPAVVLSNDAPNFGPEDAYWRRTLCWPTWTSCSMTLIGSWRLRLQPIALWDEDTEPFQE